MYDLAKLTKGVEAFYAIGDQTPVSYVLTLLWVAQNPNGNQLDLERYLASSTATTSRAVKYWSRWKSARQGGLKGAEFIEIYPDPADRRYNRLRLTKTGQMFVSNMMEAMKWQGSTATDGKGTQ